MDLSFDAISALPISGEPFESTTFHLRSMRVLADERRFLIASENRRLTVTGETRRLVV